MNQPTAMEPLLLLQRLRIDPAVYRTDIPLIVAERCRTAPAYDDGSQPAPPPLIMTWYALRWLMAAFPDHRGFNQRSIAQIAGYDQKSAHRRLRHLLNLGLVIEIGRESYPQLTGKDGRAKQQPIYSIPLDELDRLSSALAAQLLVQWEHRLFGGAPMASPQPVESQIALDLSDPLPDQADPLPDQADPVADQRNDLSDPVADQRNDLSDPVADQVPDPLPDHVSKEVSKENNNALTALPDKETDIPPAAPGESSLQMHPLQLWGQLCPQMRPVDPILLGQLAAEHDAVTGGHGWYWVGRAILATAMGPEPEDWWAKLRATMRQWRDTNTYGSDAPSRRSHRRASAAPPVAPASDTPTRISDRPILEARIDGKTRANLLSRFRRAGLAGDTATQQRIIAELESTHDHASRAM